MAGLNRYQRRWSASVYAGRPSRSRAATVGRGFIVFSILAVVAVMLYIFGFVGGDAMRQSALGTLDVGTIVPPPAPLVVPTPFGPPQPFGTLPAVQPFGAAPPPLTFAYTRSGAFTGGAVTADVFRVSWAKPSVGQVDALARRLGLTGAVRETKPGVFTVTGNGTLIAEARGTAYTPATPIPAASIPPTDDRAAASSAKGWLLARDLLPADTGPVDVRYTPDAIEVIFHPKALPDLLSPTPGVRVRMTREGAILEMTRAWPTELTPGAYSLVPLDAAWAALPQQAMVEVRLPQDAPLLPPGATAAVTIDNVSVAYALAAGKDGVDYLQPLYVFSGRAIIPGVSGPITVRAAVPAVRDAMQPMG